MSAFPRPQDDFTWLAAAHGQRDRALESDLQPHRVFWRKNELLPGLSGIQWGEKAPEILYLHGGGQNSHTWDLTASLTDAPAIAMDLPGHGHSSWRDDKNYSPRMNSKAIEPWLDDLGGIEIVVGMSLGGLTALALAGRRPELVPRLVLVDVLPGVERARTMIPTSHLGPVSLIDGAQEFSTLNEMEEAVLALAPDRGRETISRGVWHNATQTSKGTWRWRYDNLRANGHHNTEELWEVLAELRCPITLILGSRSAFVDTQSVERFHRLAPTARVEIAEGAHHAVQSDAPDRVSDIIRAAQHE